jgi:hypothetical protein
MRTGRPFIRVAVAVLAAASACGCSSSGQGASRTNGDPSHLASSTTEPEPGASGKRCGSTDGLSGWPTTMAPNLAGMQCIVAAFESGEPATFVVAEPTDDQGGHALVTTYSVVGRHELRRTVDETHVRRGGGTVVTRCRQLSSSGLALLVGECS